MVLCVEMKNLGIQQKTHVCSKRRGKCFACVIVGRSLFPAVCLTAEGTAGRLKVTLLKALGLPHSGFVAQSPLYAAGAAGGCQGPGVLVKECAFYSAGDRALWGSEQNGALT